MAIRITCPSCKATYPIDDVFRGQRILCVQCQKPMSIPVAKAAKPESPLPPIVVLSGAEETRTKSAPVQPMAPVAVSPVARSQNAEPRPIARPNSGIPVGLLIGGGVALLGLIAVAAVAVVAFFITMPSGSSTTITDQAAQPEIKREGPANGNDKHEAEPKPLAEQKKGQPRDTPQPDPKKEITEKPTPLKDTKPALPPQGGQLDREILAKVKRATVYFRVTTANGQISQGSGFFAIEPGVVLTNAHVLDMLKNESTQPKKVEIVYQSGETDQRTFVGKILGVDHSSDLAVLRVTGDNLPEPLDVKTTTDLVETQMVYVIGFPFGSSLGKNITVSSSSVSSLRKGPDGEVIKVQVNGGMHPGNSGGPVVNSQGDVVGVAVSGIEGTQINFAVPGEYVHMVLNGRVAGVSNNNTTVRDDALIKMRVNLEVLDPLERVQKVSCDWWIGPPGKSRPPSDLPPGEQPGDSPRKRLEMTYKAGSATGDIIVPPDLPPGHVIHVQPVVINGTGKPRWAGTVAYSPLNPIDKLPATLLFKHQWGARPVSFTISTSTHHSKPGMEDFDYSVQFDAKLAETMIAQQQSLAELRMRYLKFDFSVPQKLETPEFTQRMKRIVPLIGTVHANVIVDDRNNLKKTTPDLSLSPGDDRKELTKLHGPIQEAMEFLSVPLPGKKSTPGDRWTVKRALMMFTGEPGDQPPMDVTYTFEGVRQRNGREEGVITIQATAKGRMEDNSTVNVNIVGSASLDLAQLQFTMADVRVHFTRQDNAGRKMVEKLECKMERTLGKEVLKIAGQLTAKHPVDAQKRSFEIHTKKLEGGKPCVVSMESFKGAAWFDTFLRIEDADGKVLAEDDDSGVDLNAMVVFTPPQTGVYRIIAMSFQPGAMGNYLLVVRQ